MLKWKFSIVIIALSLVILAQPAAADSLVLGTWRDINPTAYINPPANPPLNSLYMLSSNEGWAVGDSLPTTNTTGTEFPAVLHYDGATWNLVPVPKNPTEVNPSETQNNIPGPYNLTSVSFGPPNNPISRNDGWAVGFTEPLNPSSLPIALHWDGVTWRAQRAGFPATPVILYSVFMVSPTDVWAVGGLQGGGGAQFWHWTGVPGLGGGWNQPQPTVTTVPFFFSVFMVSASEGWAVGTGARSTAISVGHGPTSPHQHHSS